jgi:branched-chain amino acid transport system substrate-binding protein
MFKKIATGATILAIAATMQTASVSAQDSLYVPSLSYRTGPFAGNGIPIANGFADYLNMLNERDGGIGGVKVTVDECETSYNAQKGVECYEGTKGNGALVYNPYSTGITLQLIPKAPVDKIPVLSMGYGLSAAAVGEKFPWTFTYPATYWDQMSSIIKYIDSQEGGIKGKKVGFIYLDVGYGKEPIPLLDQLAEEMGFTVAKFPVGVKEMQNQSSHWLNVRKEKPDWMVMWGFGAMNATAIKEAAKIRYPMDHFIGNWWAGANADLDPVGAPGKGYLAANMAAAGTDFPAVQDMLKYVVDAGKSQVGDRSDVGKVLYNRGMLNAVLVAEAIRTAQEMTGKKVINGEDMRLGLENMDLTAERLKELGLEGFTAPITATCENHGSGGSIFLHQWDGEKFVVVSDLIAPMTDKVRAMLEEAADKYIADKPGWQTQSCG